MQEILNEFLNAYNISFFLQYIGSKGLDSLIGVKKERTFEEKRVLLFDKTLEGLCLKKGWEYDSRAVYDKFGDICVDKLDDDIYTAECLYKLLGQDYKNLYGKDIIVEWKQCLIECVAGKEFEDIYKEFILSRTEKIYAQISKINEKNITSNNQSVDDKKYFFARISRIKEYFVETTPFQKAKNGLHKNNLILLIGKSGLGKTDASFMLAADFAESHTIHIIEGSDSGDSNIKYVKDMIIQNYENNEVFIFDDFVGKTKVNSSIDYLCALEDLLKIVKDNKNKIIILNSRNTLVEDLKIQNASIASILDNEIFIFNFNDSLKVEEKCKILVTYIKKYNLISEMRGIIKDEQYLQKVIGHDNFSPLIINRAISKCRLAQKDEYKNIIFDLLEYPDFMWKKEIEILNEFSYLYLEILFSLSDSFIKKEIVDECFNGYIEKTGIKHTEAMNFTVERLKVLIRFDENNRITFEHPSIIDYLKNTISEEDKKKIIDNAVYFEQIERLDENKKKILELINNNSIFSLKVFPYTFNNMPIKFANSILKVYLKYVYEMKLYVPEEIIIFVTEEIIKHGRLILLHSTDLIINIFSLDYDFSVIFNNEKYMKELYSCTDYDNIWKLIKLTEKNDDEKYDFLKLKDYIRYEICDKLHDFATSKYNEFIESDFNEYLEEYFDENSEEEEFYYSDVASEIIDRINDNINFAQIKDEIKKICNEHRLFNLNIEEDIDYDIEPDYDSAEKWVEEYWVDKNCK